MFINKIEEARYFFDFTNIYIVDPILIKFCVFEAHTRCKYSGQKLKYNTVNLENETYYHTCIDVSLWTTAYAVVAVLDCEIS